MSQKGRNAVRTATSESPQDRKPKSPHLEPRFQGRRRALFHLLGLIGATAATKWLPDTGFCIASGAIPISQSRKMPPLDDTNRQFFSDAQKSTVSQLADLIIPPDEVAPGARAAEVEEYLDFVVAHADKEEQRQWTEGLALLNELATQRGEKAFRDLEPGQQLALLRELSSSEGGPRSPAEKFFVRLKTSVAEGYYTSEIGLREDLKYRGNTVSTGPATCKDHFGKDFPTASFDLPGSAHPPKEERSSPQSMTAIARKTVPPAPASEAQSGFERDLKAICAREYDVCIIGSGAAGGIAAKELTEQGLQVVVLEAGGWVSSSRFRTHVPPYKMPFRGRWSSHGENDYTGFLYVKDPVTCPAEPIDYALLPAVGGKTLTWAGISWRFGERDFQNRGYGDDWPFGYAELEPYYTRAELFMGVSGSRDGLAFAPDGHFLKPFVLRCGEQLIKEACERRLGPAYRVIPLRKAINTESHGGRPRCHYCGYCMRGCHINALYSSANSAVPAARATGRLTLVTNAVVRELEVNSAGTRAAGAVFIDRDTRQEHRVRARVYALACGGVEDVRILLMSKSEHFPHGLANSSGWVGKNLVSEHYYGCLGYLDRLLGSKVLNEDGAGQHAVVQNIYYENPSKKFARGYMIDLQSGPEQIPSHPALVPGFGEKYREEVRRIYAAVVSLSAHGEILASEKNYVDLDPVARDEFGLPKARMHQEWSENEIAMVRDEREQCRAIIEAAGGKVLGFSNENLKPHFDGENLVGTVRMGRDREKSVLDPQNRTHDVNNLWVLDGASFTSYNEKNPTLTVIAVAMRAAEHLAEALRRGEV